MEITRLEVIKVKPRWMFLKMHTDTDIYGQNLEVCCIELDCVKLGLVFIANQGQRLKRCGTQIKAFAEVTFATADRCDVSAYAFL